MKSKLLKIFLLFVFALTLVSCGEETSTQVTNQTTITNDSTTNTTSMLLNDLEERLYVIYELVLETDSFSGTFNEWMSSVNAPRDDSQDIEFFINGDYLQWRYVGDLSWSNLVEVSNLSGLNNSLDSFYIDSNDDLILVYGDNQINLGELVIHFEVSFYDQDGGLIDTQYVEYGSNALEPSAPLVEGYSFNGWIGSFDSVSSNLQIDASYILNSYTISYEENGGSLINDISYDYGTNTSEPSNPTREGYTFDGWYEDPELTSLYTFTTMPAKDFTLYAKWNVNQYTITFEENGGSSVTDITQDYDTEVTVPSEPERQGYTFAGWHTDIELMNSYTFGNMPSNDITLYAKWNANLYTVNYNLNDGLSTVSTVTAYADSEILIPEREGYTFVRWYSNPSLTIEYNGDFPLENMDLYAFWEKNSYVITYVVPSIGDDLGETISLFKDEVITDVAIGEEYNIVLTSFGRLFTFGANYHGQLGNGTNEISHTPIEITGFFSLNQDEKITKVYAGFSHSIVLTSEGRILGWGNNNDGQLGIGDTINHQYVITDITNLIGLQSEETIENICLGGNQTMILTSLGRLVFFGEMDETLSYFVPTDITDSLGLSQGENIDSIFVNRYTRAVVTSNNRILIWGRNDNGVIGDGTTQDVYAPLDITSYFSFSTNETIISIDSSYTHTILLTSLGRVYAWGSNDFGQLGNGTIIESLTPIEITSYFNLGGSKIIQAYSGYNASSALTDDGKVFTWGDANYGQLADGQVGIEGISSLLPTEVTSYFGLDQSEQITSLYTNRKFNEVITSDNRVIQFGYMFFTYGELRYLVYPMPEVLTVKEAVIDSEVTYYYEDLITNYIPSRDGYTFAGWYLEPSFVTEFTDTYMPANDLILYAKFTKIDYSIDYYGDDSTTVENPVSYNIETEDIILNVPEREGYIYKWYDNNSYTGQPVTEILKGSMEDITLYGRWELIEYTITYSLGVNGENNVVNPISYNIETPTISLLDPTRPGYTFDNWSVSTIPTGSTGDITITANWSPITYNISYNIDGGVNSIHNPLSYDPNTFDFSFFDATKDNYSFGGWFDNPEFTGDPVLGVQRYDYGDITLYAKWIPDTYNIIYDTDGGTNNAFNPDTYTYDDTIDLADPSKPGYDFDGWYDNSSFTGTPITDIEEHSIGDVTLYAKWILHTYTITYYPNGGTTPSTLTYTIEDVNIFIGASERDGYFFDGWFDNPELTGDSISRIPDGSYGDVTLYAGWDIRTYTITYDLDGATENNNPSSYTIEDTPITLNAPIKAGYTFDGFYTNASFTGDEVTEIPLDSTGSYYLYAKWILTEYTITYNLDNGTNDSTNPNTYTINSSLIAFEDPQKTGYIFGGWYYNPGFTGEEVEYIYANSTGNVTLYAKWTAIEYTIDYLIMDGSYISGDIVLLPGETIIQVEVSTYHSAALTSNGRMFTWGNNSNGELGDNSKNDSNTPIDITDNFNLASGETITYISLGPKNSAAITSDGRVFTWGNYHSYSYNVLGSGAVIEDQLVPLDITANFSLSTGETITKILLAEKHAAALSSDGNYFIWGRRDYHINSGTRTTPGGNRNVFLNLNTNEYVVDIAISELNSAILTSEGRLLVWGDNDNGQLGNGTTFGSSSTIDITSNLSLAQGETIEGLSLGYYHMGVYTSNNRVLTWGLNIDGQLGNDSTTSSSLPIDISSEYSLDTGDSIISIYFEFNTSSFITANGEVYIWGMNERGNIGDGTIVDKHTPQLVSSLISLGSEQLISLSISMNNSAVVSSDGRVFIWGDNIEGQLGGGSISAQYSPYEITFYNADLDSHVIYYYNDLLDYTPTLSGYTFDGWYTDPDCTQAFTLTNMPEENLILYGKWVIN